MLPDKILPVQRIRWTVNTEGTEAQEKGGCFFHVLIWMTWQQSRQSRHWGTTAVLLNEHTDWRRSFQRRHFAAHGMSLPCRWGGGACECTAMSEESASFYMIKKILLLGQWEYMVSLLIWPCVLLLWLFIGPWLCFCAEETPAESWLPADRTYFWTHGRMAAHPIKSTGAHTGSGKVWRGVCVCVAVCVGI